MARINIKSVTVNSNLVSGADNLRIILCPFDNQGGDLKEIAAKLEEKAMVFNYTLSHSKKQLLNIVIDFDYMLDVHIFSKPSAPNVKVYDYLGTCNFKNISTKETTKSSKNNLFTLQYVTENSHDMIPVTIVTGYIFQINRVTCNKKEDYSDDEIRFELIPDNDSNNKVRFPVNRSYFKFKKGQTRRFTEADKTSVKFKNEIKVIVWEIDSPDANDKLGERIFTSSHSSGTFKANWDDADYDITYNISEVKTEIDEERKEFSWLPSTNYNKLNFSPFFNKIEDVASRFSTILKEIPSQKTPQPTSDDIISPQLNEEINPLNNEEFDRIKEFITEYYQEFFDNKDLLLQYIEELTHSQYPVMAYPVYPEPAYYYLKQVSDRFVLPASDAMPDNSMALFVNNPAFVEAFLCGMNTEMGRELLWREYPTDSRGSYFRKFWDTEVKKDIKQELHLGTFFDILPIHKWVSQEFEPQNSHKLGQNHTAGKDNLLIFAIKGELLKKYPETIIYLSKASLDGNKILINPDAVKILPDLSAWLNEDTYLVGFPAKLNELTGNPATRDPGYFLTFMNRPGETRFGHYEDKPLITINHAGDTAADLLVQPSIFGKHVSQFLTGWKNA